MAGTLGVTTTSQTFPALVADDTFGPVRLPKTILTGQELAAGTIVAAQTSGGKIVAYDADGTDDGQRTAIGVLLEAVDTSTVAGDKEGIVGYAGVYVKDNMTGLDDAAELALEARGIYFKSL